MYAIWFTGLTVWFDDATLIRNADGSFKPEAELSANKSLDTLWPDHIVCCPEHDPTSNFHFRCPSDNQSANKAVNAGGSGGF